MAVGSVTTLARQVDCFGQTSTSGWGCRAVPSAGWARSTWSAASWPWWTSSPRRRPSHIGVMSPGGGQWSWNIGDFDRFLCPGVSVCCRIRPHRGLAGRGL